MIYITQSVAKIREEIANAALNAGRKPEDITLLAASKTRSAEEIQTAIAAGITAVGENRAQELVEKYTQGAYDGAALHFIGKLQSNKAKYLVGRVDMIQSVDSERLCQTISRLAVDRGVTQKILMEVNIGHEPGKAGVLPEDAFSLCERIGQMPGVLLCGLMAIPPAEEDPKPYFYEMRKLFEEMAQMQGPQFSVLSMGMSGDFADAIAEGSTLIRIGTALFGDRPAAKPKEAQF